MSRTQTYYEARAARAQLRKEVRQRLRVWAEKDGYGLSDEKDRTTLLMRLIGWKGSYSELVEAPDVIELHEKIEALNGPHGYAVYRAMLTRIGHAW